MYIISYKLLAQIWKDFIIKISAKKNRISNHQAYKSEIFYVTNHQLSSADHADSACQHEW